MRQKLNENPVAQIALIGVLALLAVVFLLKPFGGGESASESEAGAEAATSTASPEEAAASLGRSAGAPAASAVSAPAERPLPRDVESAYESGETVVLLIYRPNGIDDRRLTAATRVLAGMPGAALFAAPVDKIARYSALTGPLGVNQAPALIVVPA